MLNANLNKYIGFDCRGDLSLPRGKYKHDVELESKHKTGKSLMLNLKC